jgi:sarcosine oxidase
MPEKYDVIVVGLGAFGAATLCHLAGRGGKVLGIDRHNPPHTFGSTHGETRITRFACGEGADYTQFVRRSHALWREYEEQSAAPLFVQNGLLVISGPGPRALAHGKENFLDETFGIARQNGTAHEALDEAALRARFPALNIGADERAYFEPGAGYVSPEAAIEVQLRIARQAGAAIHTDETVERFDPRTGAVEVVTNRATYTADKLVIAAGPWVPQFVPALAPRLTVRRQVLAWFRIDEAKLSPEYYRPERFPVFVWQVPREKTMYAFPWTGDGTPSVKVGTEQYHSASTADTVDRTVGADEIAALYRDYVAAFLPGLSGDCVRSAACPYTCTEDSHFIIDRLPDDPRVTVVSACSGHGFKHSPAIGEAIAELTTQGHTSHVSLEAFRLPR